MLGMKNKVVLITETGIVIGKAMTFFSVEKSAVIVATVRNSRELFDLESQLKLHDGNKGC